MSLEAVERTRWVGNDIEERGELLGQRGRQGRRLGDQRQPLLLIEVAMAVKLPVGST